MYRRCSCCLGLLLRFRTCLPTLSQCNDFVGLIGRKALFSVASIFIKIVFFRRRNFMGGFHFSEATVLKNLRCLDRATLFSSGLRVNSQFSRSSIWRNFETNVFFSYLQKSAQTIFSSFPLQYLNKKLK